MNIEIIYYFILITILVLICIDDFIRLKISNTLLFLLLLIVLFIAQLQNIYSAITLFSIFIILKIIFDIRKKCISLGIGDIKLIFICGLLIQSHYLHILLILCGTFNVITHILYRRYQKNIKIVPMAPAICIATIIIGIL